MNESEITQKLEEFQEYLSVSNIFTELSRWLGWALIQGLAWIVDALENVADTVLLLKSFYANEDIVGFVDSIKPFLYILLAFSILYAGYMLIFNKKFNREGMIINLFVACAVILLLSSGMDRAGEFTDAAIDAVKVEALYPNDESTLSGSIIQRNVVDLTEIDKNLWASTELDKPNSTPPSKIKNINFKEKYGKDSDGISKEGEDISKHFLSLNNEGEYRAEKFDQGGLEWNNEYYFRYAIDWFTILITLGVIAFTLFSISLKLARLSFELTFNYILALIVAPADVHDGQKTKQIIQSILNTFIVIILIFLSMKVYMIGTAYLENTLTTVPYLIALIAFSLAVIDGPNMVERLFGIDAGLKSGWGVAVGAYTGMKLASGVGKGMMNLASKAKSGNQNNDTNKPIFSSNDLNSKDPISSKNLNSPVGKSGGKKSLQDEMEEEQQRKHGNNKAQNMHSTSAESIRKSEASSMPSIQSSSGSSSLNEPNNQSNAGTKRGQSVQTSNPKSIQTGTNPSTLSNNSGIAQSANTGSINSTTANNIAQVNPSRFSSGISNATQTTQQTDSVSSQTAATSPTNDQVDVIRNDNGARTTRSTEQINIVRNDSGSATKHSTEQMDVIRSNSDRRDLKTIEEVEVIQKPRQYSTGQSISKIDQINKIKNAERRI